MPKNTTIDKALAALAASPTTKTLTVSLTNKPITTGEYFPRAAAQTAPEISYAAATAATKYIVICLDLDAPFQSWTGLGPILHWIQPGLVAAVAGDAKLEVSEPFVADYIGPAPPPGSGPHRYSFYLFAQPEGFEGKKFAPADGKKLGNLGRIRFSLDDWIMKAGLGEPIAVNYFTSN